MTPTLDDLAQFATNKLQTTVTTADISISPTYFMEGLMNAEAEGLNIHIDGPVGVPAGGAVIVVEGALESAAPFTTFTVLPLAFWSAYYQLSQDPHMLEPRDI